MTVQVSCAETEKKNKGKYFVQLCAICRTEDNLSEFKDKLICNDCIVAIKGDLAQ